MTITQPYRSEQSGELPLLVSTLKPSLDDAGDPAARVPVSEREGRTRHRETLERILEKPPDLGNDSLGRRANETRVAARDALRSLRFLAQDEKGSAQGGSLFLDSAGIAQHQLGITHSADQLAMAAWRDQRNSPN